MSTVPLPRRVREIRYPTTDGKPMAETDLHRRLMTELIASLQAFYAAEPMVYVSGNLLLFYEQGNRRRHLAPDVFVVRGVGKHERENYLMWEEGQPPRFVIELTSSSTRRNDTGRKFELYRDVLKVREYFMFDPYEDYLEPSMQGWRLRGGVYHPIRAVDGRLPSQTTGLHLERDGRELRLWNPATKERLLLPVQAEQRSRLQAQARADQSQARADEAKARADEAEARAARAEAELRRLRERFGLPGDVS